MIGTTRFPDVTSNPRSTPDLIRTVRELQESTSFTVPEVATLPASGFPNQIVALNGGGSTPQLYWWSQGAWVALWSGSAPPAHSTIDGGGP